MTDSMEWWGLVLGVVQVVLLAAITAWAQIQKTKLDQKTERWENMTQRAVDASEGAQSLAAESKDVVDQIAKQTNGITAKLVDRNAKATFAAGMMKAELNRIAREHGTVSKDDLDRIEEEFIKNVESDAGK